MSDRSNPAVNLIERLMLRQKAVDEVVRAERSLVSLIAERDVRRWIVFEGDWGGQIYASVPLSMLPADFTVREVDDFLKSLDRVSWESNEGEGASWSIVQDCGVIRGKVLEDVANEAMLPGNVLPAEMLREPLDDCEPRLEGWVLVGGVTGGMGGGGLLNDDVWFHHEFVKKGHEEVNRLRALLHIAPRTTFCIVERSEDAWDDEDLEG
jgi:hypothetical protein